MSEELRTDAEIRDGILKVLDEGNKKDYRVGVSLGNITGFCNVSIDSIMEHMSYLEEKGLIKCTVRNFRIPLMQEFKILASGTDCIRNGGMLTSKSTSDVSQTINISGNHTGHIVGEGDAVGNIVSGNDFFEVVLERIKDDQTIPEEEKASLSKLVQELMVNPALANIISAMSLVIK